VKWLALVALGGIALYLFRPPTTAEEETQAPVPEGDARPIPAPTPLLLTIPATALLANQAQRSPA